MPSRYNRTAFWHGCSLRPLRPRGVRGRPAPRFRPEPRPRCAALPGTQPMKLRHAHAVRAIHVGLLLAAPERRCHADGGFTIVEAPGGERRAPCVRLEPAVRIMAGAGQGDERREMSHETGHEVPPGVAEPLRIMRVIQEISCPLPIPETDVDVTPASYRLGEGLGREAGNIDLRCGWHVPLSSDHLSCR